MLGMLDTGSCRIGERADEEQRDAHQGRADRAADEGLGNIHSAGSGSAPSTARNRRAPADARAHALDRKIDDRRRIERQQLAERQAADDRHAERDAGIRCPCRCASASGTACRTGRRASSS